MLRLAFAWLLLLPVFAAAQDLPGNGQVAALLDPARNLKQAQSSLASGDSKAARDSLTVALELSRIDSPDWAAAMLVAAQNFPDLAAAMLAGPEGQEVPLTLMPEPIEATTRVPFTLPASYVRLDFLPPNRKRILDHMVRTGQEVEATRTLERDLEGGTQSPQLLLYLAALYERINELPLAMQRYQEAYDKATIDEDRFAMLYSMLRVLYKQQKFFDAEALLKPYNQLARAQVTQLVDKVKSSPGGRENLLSQLVGSRRHLVEALNLEGILRLRKGEVRNAQFLFHQALLLAPGRLPIALNYNQTLEQGGHYETATANLSRIRQVLTAVSTELQRLLDSSLNAGTSIAGGGYAGIQESLKRWLGVVTTRQGVVLYDLRRLAQAERVLAEASAYAAEEPLPFYYLGLLQQEQKRLGEALVNFRKALTFAGERSELARLAKGKVDQILEAQTAELLAARSPEERAREQAGDELDAKKLEPLQKGVERGRALMAQKKHAEAAELFTRLSQDYPRHADSLYYLGLIRHQNSDLEGAQRYFEQALKVVPVYAPAMSQLAYVYSEIGFDAREAVSLAERAKVLAPLDAAIVANLGWVYFYSGDARRAIEALKQAIELAPKVSEYHMRLGLVFYKQQLFQLALSKFQDLLAVDPSNARATVFLGLSQAKLGQAREALATLGGVVSKFPPPSELNRVLVNTMASLRTGLEARGEAVPAALGPAPASPGKIIDPAVTPQQAQLASGANRAIEEALALLKSGRRDEARATLDAGVEKFKADPELAYSLALVHLEDGELEQASALLNAILDASPLDLRAAHSLGDIYFREGRLVEYKDVLDRTAGLSAGLRFSPFLEALASRWKQILDTGGPDATAFYRLGLLRFHEHRLDEAKQALEKADKLPEANVLLAQMRLHEYHRTKSEIEFQTARDLLTKAGYKHMDGLDRLWTSIRSPRLSEVEAQVEKELARRKKVELAGDVFSRPMVETAKGGELDVIDIRGTGIIENRRWEQITNKIEKTRVARTTYRDRQQPVLEEIELDPGRRFRQPGGPGIKAGPLPSRSIGAAAGLSEETTAPATSPAPVTPVAPSVAPADPLSLPAMVELPLPAANPKQGLAEKKLAMGVALVAQGRLIEAKADFQTAVALDQKLERAHAALALTHLSLDETEAALQVSRRAAKLFPAERIRGQAQALMALGRGDAKTALDLWLPEPPERLEDFAYISESRKIWQRVLDDAPGDADATYQLALLAYLEGDASDALRRIATLRDRAGRAGTLYAAATLCEAIRKRDREAFERGIAILRVAPMPGLAKAVAVLEEHASRM